MTFIDEIDTSVDDCGQHRAQQMIDSLMSNVRELTHELDHLRAAMAHRAPIEQAKGILMYRLGLDADAAFQVLTRWSSTSNIKLRLIALAVVDGVSQGVVPDDPALADLVSQVAGAPSRPAPSRVPRPTTRPSSADEASTGRKQ